MQAIGAGGAALALQGCASLSGTGGGHDEHPPPNIVVILADDMGYGDSSCYNGWIQTPCLDKMAAKGRKFTDFHSSGTVCSPTRAGLMTGRYQERAGITGVINADPEHPSHALGLDPSEITFPGLLKSRGYATAIFGKWHLGYTRNFNPLHHGFDRFRGYVSGNIDYISHYDRMGTYDWWDGMDHVDEKGYVTHLVTGHGVDFIVKNKDRPFFLYLSHQAVHAPFQGPEDPPGRGPSGVKNDKKDRKETYARMMQELDIGVGKILETLNTLGIAENTLVFFLSDNGAAAPDSNAPFRGKKGSVWEGGHRVPALAWWPGKITPGSVSDDLAISLDLFPTILNLAGVDLPEEHDLDGIDLSPLLLENRNLPSRELFWKGRAMRSDQWKLIINDTEVQLFDLSADKEEQNDIAAKHPDRVKEMLASVDKWSMKIKG